MKTCPTCKAPYRGGTACFRCKSDLALLLAIEEEAGLRLQRARYLASAGRYGEALEEARRSLFLLRTEEGEEFEGVLLLKCS